jgi:hypothetical protein
VYGGYIEDVFTGETKWIVGHTTNFVFSLDQHRPIKLIHNPNDTDGVYMSTASAGLYIGGGPDLRVFGDTNGYGYCNPRSYTTAHADYPHSTPITPGQLAGLTGGVYKWKGDEVIAEVFQCS